MFILHKNIHCDPSSEPSRRGGSDEGSQHMVSMINKKNYHQYFLLSRDLWQSTCSKKKLTKRVFFYFRMADSMDEKHGTSDEYVDPYCDPCFEGKGLNVKVFGYCKDCFQFLCSDCHVFHGKFQVAKNHIILQGSSMPQSQADKPPKFPHCDDHPASVKDQFCCDHKNMICSSCSLSHTNCTVQSIGDVCKNISSSETDSLYDAVKNLKEQAMSVMSSVTENIEKLKEQRKSILKEVQQLYDQIISKMKKIFQDMEADIEANCQSQILLMSQHQEKINAMIAKLESSMTDIEKLQGKHIDTKLFLKIQENINDTNQVTDEFRNVNKSLLFVDLSFIPSKTIQEFLSASVTMGSVSKSHKNQGTYIAVTDIVFPSALQSQHIARVEPQQQSCGHKSGATGLQTRSLSQVKATKKCEYKVKIKGDKEDCYINGMAVTKDGRILMADYYNNKVKLFSPAIKFLSSVSVPDRPCDIAVISDSEAAATTTNKSLVLLDISGFQLRIKTTTKVPYNIRGITKYKNKLVISSRDPTTSVKLIDLTGKVYWSVSSDQQGHSLFSHACHLTSHDEGRSSTVIVTDLFNNMLTLLNGETGEVITRRQLQWTGPNGVTTDTAGNVYVCYCWTHEVLVLSGDLSEEKILLSTQNGLSGMPQAIVYDDKTRQLLISYVEKDIVDSFKLS